MKGKIPFTKAVIIILMSISIGIEILAVILIYAIDIVMTIF